MPRSYEITERPAELGGGWLLTMYQAEEEMGRGVYPLPVLDEWTDEGEPVAVDEEVEHTMDRLCAEILYAAAVSDGESWLSLTD